MKHLFIKWIKTLGKFFCLKRKQGKNIPVYIIAYNNLYHVSKMVSQLEKYTQNIFIIDNNSNYPKLLEYYEKEFKYKLIRMEKNEGHLVFLKLMDTFPEYFVVTDPDLEFNENMPLDFLDQLVSLAKKYDTAKMGLALSISDSDEFVPGPYHGRLNIVDWENQFWKNRISNKKYELYEADIDTTFFVGNKKRLIEYYRDISDKKGLIRVAGNFTCKHLPWYKENWIHYPNDELSYYNTANCSTIMKMLFDAHRIEKNGVAFEIGKNMPNFEWWLKHYDNWENETFYVLDKFLDTDKNFLDIGSWMGPLTLYALKKSSHVYAVECDRDSIFEIIVNVSINHDGDRFSLINKAIYEKDEEKLYFGPNMHVNLWDELNMSTSQIRTEETVFPDPKKEYLVETITLKALIHKYSIENLSLIKIDIEGAEEYILNEAIDYVISENVSSFISFHIPWWEKYTLDQFAGDISSKPIEVYAIGKNGNVYCDEMISKTQLVEKLAQNGMASFLFRASAN